MDNVNDIDFINSIFSDFFKFCHFNPDSEKDNEEHYRGNLFTYEADAWEISRLIVRLVKEYNSPYLAFIVLKADVSSWGKNVKFCLDEIIENEHLKFLKIYKKVFYDEKCIEIENTFINNLSRFSSKPNLIGNADVSKIIKKVPEIIKEVEELNFHPFLIGNEKLGEVEIRNKIRIYTDIENCLLDIESKTEGLYLCYINPKDSIDGYFSFIYKSNGNIISINDQIKEAYIGQHKVERRRNASYVENKAFETFPYSFMFELSKPDIKGYFTEYKLKGEFSLNDLPIDNVFSLVIAMLLIIKKYCNKTIDKKELCYSSYLIGNKAEKLIETKALTIKNNSAILLHAKTKVELTRDEILSDCNGGKRNRDNFYSYWKPDVVNYLKNLWVDDEIINSIPVKGEYSHILNNTENIEMISSYDTLKMNALFVMRKEMKEKIQRKIEQYFISKDFGNEGVKKWRNLVESKKDIIFSKLNGENFFESKNRKGICIGHLENGKLVQRHYDRGYFPFNDIHNYKIDWTTSRNDAYMHDDNGVCRYRWDFFPSDWKKACEFIEIEEDELPKELKGWTNIRNEKYGNSILSMTDYMEDLQNGYMCFYDAYFGMSRNCSDYLNEQLKKLHGNGHRIFADEYAIYNRANPFEFSIAFSPRAFKKMFPNTIPNKKEE